METKPLFSEQCSFIFSLFIYTYFYSISTLLLLYFSLYILILSYTIESSVLLYLDRR